jgi:hypothetical protein
MENQKFESFKEAAASVQGTKIRLVTSKKMFAVPGFGLEDMFAVADAAIFEAFKTWDPEVAKFNTHAHNMINYKLSDSLNEMNGRWKVIEQITYEQSYYKKETYKTVKATGKTLNEQYNLENELDGSETAKKRVNRNIWNGYLQYLAHIQGTVSLINAGQFMSATEGAENFDIMDTAEDLYINSDDDYEDRLAPDVHALSADKQKIAKMLLDGATIAEVANEMKLSQIDLMQIYAPEPKAKAKTETKYYIPKVKRSKVMSAEAIEFLSNQKAKKELLYS